MIECFTIHNVLLTNRTRYSNFSRLNVTFGPLFSLFNKNYMDLTLRVPPVCSTHAGQKRASDFPRPEAAGSCELPLGCWDF